jgi:hypothetical protein
MDRMRSFFERMSSGARTVSRGLEGGPRRVGPDVPPAYAALHGYLDNRFASSVVLTFEQIESLLKFPLPEAARTDGNWWTRGDAHAEAWTKARRSATPNLLARHVTFERCP